MAYFGRAPKKPQQLGREVGGRTRAGVSGEQKPGSPGKPSPAAERSFRQQRASRTLRMARSAR